MTESDHTPATRRAEVPNEVLLQFRHDQKNSGVSRHGVLRPGGQLRVEYDAGRLGIERRSARASEAVCHALFRPSGQQLACALVARPMPVQSNQLPQPVTCNVQLPEDARAVELWFEARNAQATEAWDSRYGRNYVFAIVAEGLPTPPDSVTLRPEAIVDPQRIWIVEDAASKAEVRFGAGGSQLQTGLVIRVHLERPSATTNAWADIHLFDAADEAIHAMTVQLEEADPERNDPGLRVWDSEVYSGSGGASGTGVWSRPDVHTVQYRVYCQVDGQVFTNGILHQFTLPADSDIRHLPGGW
jgi:hypothetical protein